MFRKILPALVTLVLVGIFAGVALAQDRPAKNGWGANAPEFFQSFLDKFASALGVDKDRIVEAAKEAGKQTVDEALQQGKITADQAERMKARIDEGRWFPCPFPGGKGLYFGGPPLDELAQALGMTQEELKAQLDQGKKISDIAQEKGLTEEQLRQKLLDAKIQAIQQAVQDGKIPQDKADQMIQRLQNAPQGKAYGHFFMRHRSSGQPSAPQESR
ncbi:MAG: hypothetical protein H5T97_05905 [Firmicutes bacterium]|nr:hypothetical protein [Bacillota bacterium]